MVYQDSVPAIREKRFLGKLLPGRKEAPVVVAAVGTVLLTTADVQPLMPSSVLIRIAGPSAAPTMGKAWQVLIVAVLLAVSAGAVLRGWRHIRGSAAILVCAICAAALLVNIVVLYPAVSVADLMTRRVNWASYGPMFILPFLACIATVLLALAADKRFASGALLAIGAGGYLFYFQQLDFYLGLRFFPEAPAPGRATFAGMIGAGIVLIAGLAARWDNTPEPGKAPRAAVLAAQFTAAAGAIAVAVAVFYLYVAFLLPPTGSAGFVLHFASSLVVYAVAPAALAGAACLAVAGRRDPDRRFAAGVLVTSGFLGLSYFLYSHVFAWLVPVGSGSGQALLGDDIGVGGCLAFMLAGFTLLASRQAAASARAGTVPAADDEGEGAAARSDSTRYLCAAAHFDGRFAGQAIDRLAGNPHQAVMPSLGVDTGTVLRHCFAARRRQIVRDVLITVIVLGILPIVLDFRSRVGLRDVAVLIVLAAVVAFSERWISRYRVAARQLSGDTFDPWRAPLLTTEEQKQLDQVQASERGNINVYGTYSPFVGSGSSQGGWSFAVNTGKGKEPPGSTIRLDPKPFEIEELYHAVCQDIEALDLTELLIENRLLVDGQSIRDDKRFIHDRMAPPATTIGAELLGELVRAPEPCNRTYQCVRMADWRGDLVLSVFINFTRRGSGLLTEVQHYLLAPVREAYREADQLASRTTARRVKTELRAAPAPVTAALVMAPFRTCGSLWRLVTRWNRERSIKHRIDDNPEYNYGAGASIRELAQSDRYRKYFQQLDRSLNAKLIDRQLLDTIMTFLDAHNIDTSQFEEQRTTILNQGLLISGGQLSAGSIAVGERSRAGVTQFMQNIPANRKQGDNP
jgi:hypothetical protein